MIFEKILVNFKMNKQIKYGIVGAGHLGKFHIQQASKRFLSSSDENLRDWLDNYPGEKLEAICFFCISRRPKSDFDDPVNKNLDFGIVFGGQNHEKSRKKGVENHMFF